MRPNIGRAVAMFRSSRRLDQTQLAQLSGCDPSFISLIELGQRTPSMEMFCQLAKALDVQPWVLMFVAEGKPDRSQPLVEKVMWCVLEEMLK